MKIKILIILMFFGLNAFSQNLKVGINYSLDPKINSNFIDYKNYQGYSITNYNSNFSFGISFEKLLADKFYIISGLEYSKKDFTGIYYCAVCDFIVPPQPENFKLRFIEIPITSRYYFLNNRTSIFGEAGIKNSIITKKSKLQENGFLISGNLGVGLGLKFFDNIYFEIISSYQKSISKLYKDSDFKQKQLVFKIGVKKEL